MTQYSTDFSEYTSGQAPTGWSHREGADPTTLFTVENQADATGGKVLRRNNIGQYSAQWCWDEPSDDPGSATVQIVGRLRHVSGSNKWISLVGSTYAGIRNVVDNLRVNFDAATSKSFPMTTGDWFWMRYTGDASGVTIEGWYDGQDPDVDAVVVFSNVEGAGGGKAGVGTYEDCVVEWDYFSVGTGGDSAPMPAAPASTATRIARYLLNEASSGTAPTTAADDTGNNNTLTIDYSGGDANWTSITEGNGLDFTQSAARNNSATVMLSNLALNGNIGSELNGTKTLWSVVVFQNVSGGNQGPYLLHLGTLSGAGDFAIVRGNGDAWTIAWDQETGGGNYAADFSFAVAANTTYTMIVQIDTDGATADDRVKVWINGTAQTLTSNTVPSGSALNLSVLADRNFSVGNRASSNRNIQGQIFYAEIGKGVLTAQERTAIETGLAANNDQAWTNSGGVQAVTVPAAQSLHEGTTVALSSSSAVGAVTGQQAVQTQAAAVSTSLPIGAVVGQQAVNVSPVTTTVTSSIIPVTGQQAVQAQAVNPVQAGVVGAVTGQQAVQTQTTNLSQSVSTVTVTGQQAVDVQAVGVTTVVPVGAVTTQQVVQAQAVNLVEAALVTVVTGQQAVATQLASLTTSVPVGAVTGQQVVQAQQVNTATPTVLVVVTGQQAVQAQAVNLVEAALVSAVTGQQVVQAQAVGLVEAGLVSAVTGQQAVQAQAVNLVEAGLVSAVTGQQAVQTQAVGLIEAALVSAVTGQQAVQTQAVGLVEAALVNAVTGQQVVQTQTVTVTQPITGGAIAVEVASVQQLVEAQVVSLAESALVGAVTGQQAVETQAGGVTTAVPVGAVTCEQQGQGSPSSLVYVQGTSVVVVDQATDLQQPVITGAFVIGGITAEQNTQGSAIATLANLIVVTIDVEQVTQLTLVDVTDTPEMVNARSLRANKTTIGYTVNRESLGFAVSQTPLGFSARKKSLGVTASQKPHGFSATLKVT